MMKISKNVRRFSKGRTKTYSFLEPKVKYQRSIRDMASKRVNYKSDRGGNQGWLHSQDLEI
jgi:hypothetical protein